MVDKRFLPAPDSAPSSSPWNFLVTARGFIVGGTTLDSPVELATGAASTSPEYVITARAEQCEFGRLLALHPGVTECRRGGMERGA